MNLNDMRQEMFNRFVDALRTNGIDAATNYLGFCIEMHKLELIPLPWERALLKDLIGVLKLPEEEQRQALCRVALTHCLRCVAICKALWANGAGIIDMTLDCGHTWEEADHSDGKPPPDAVAALAFLTPDEAQKRHG